MSIASVGSSGAVPSMAAGQFMGGQISGAPGGALAPDSMSNPQQGQPAPKFADGVYGVRPEHNHKKKHHHNMAIALGIAAATVLGALALIATHGRLWGKTSTTAANPDRTKHRAEADRAAAKTRRGADSNLGHDDHLHPSGASSEHDDVHSDAGYDGDDDEEG